MTNDELMKLAQTLSNNPRRTRVDLAQIDDTPHTPLSLFKAKNILISGATGFVGAYLIAKLLRETTAKLHCLVRCEDAEAGLTRVAASLKKYGLSSPDLAKRVRAMPADLAKARLGLSKDLYLELQDRVDLIFHLGASINWVADYDELKRVNIFGTVNILDFAKSGAPKTLLYISTTGVYGARDAAVYGYLNKGASLERYKGHFTAYFKTKWLAELKVQAAFAGGLDGFILRPSFISGPLQGGCYLPSSDLTRLFLLSGVKMAKFPDVNVPIDIIPVDILVEAILNVGALKGAGKRIYNLSNPSMMSLADAGRLAGKIGLAIDVVSYEQWKKCLFSPSNEKDIRLIQLINTPLPGSTDGFIKLFDNVPVDNKDIDTKAALIGTNISCPSVQEMFEQHVKANVSSYSAACVHTKSEAAE